MEAECFGKRSHHVSPESYEVAEQPWYSWVVVVVSSLENDSVCPAAALHSSPSVAEKSNLLNKAGSPDLSSGLVGSLVRRQSLYHSVMRLRKT